MHPIARSAAGSLRMRLGYSNRSRFLRMERESPIRDRCIPLFDTLYFRTPGSSVLAQANAIVYGVADAGFAYSDSGVPANAKQAGLDPSTFNVGICHHI